MRRSDRATKLLALHRRRHRQRPPRDARAPSDRPLAGTPTRQVAPAHRRAGPRRQPPAPRSLGPTGFAEWMRAESAPCSFTDTTMRDAHQSLLATRMRTIDIAGAADAYARALPELLSLECWGGATFDVSMRFLTRGPVGAARARSARRAPNMLLQMLVRGANGVGYTATTPTTRSPSSSARRRRTASISSACSTASTGSTTCACRWTRCSRRASSRRGGDLLHGRHARPRAPEVRPRLLRLSSLRRAREGRRAHPVHQGHGRV